MTCLEAAKEAVVRPQESIGVDNRRAGFPPKLQHKQVMNVKSNTQSSIYTKDNEIDMTDTDDDILPPPPPPFLINSDIENPVVPTIVSATRHPVKSQNLSSVRVFAVAALQQYTNSFARENCLGAGNLGSVYRAELPDGEV